MAQSEISGPVLRRSLRLITFGVCLCMVYVPVTASPIFTEFLREMGATAFHFGLLAGIPMSLFVMQFVGALINNRIRNRKVPFTVLLIASRLVYLIIAFSPLLFPGLHDTQRIALILALVSGGALLLNLAAPLWFAWMADLIPHSLLGRYWGNRQRWMFVTWTISYVGMAVFTYATPWPASTTYPILACISVAAGITDILLFIGVPDPGNTLVTGVSVLQVLKEPFQHAEYRTFVRWSVVKSFAMMLSGAFLQLYALDVLKMPLWQTTIAWCILGIGVALSSRMWGRIADAHGQRPVLLLVMYGKPIVSLVFLLVTPATAFPVLSTWFFFDGVLNGGLLVATDGYMLRMAPRRNRSMFIATITGLAGISGGIGAIAGGHVIQMLSGWHWNGFGREWNHYQVVFAVSFLLRLLCIPLTARIREVKSSSTLRVLLDVAGQPQRSFLRFPIGLYRRMQQNPDNNS